jgi:hypothetical protein
MYATIYKHQLLELMNLHDIYVFLHITKRHLCEFAEQEVGLR